MGQTAATKEKQAKLSYFAGALFFLAGAMGFLAGMHHARGENYGLGGMFVALGALWVMIGNRNRREARAIAASEGVERGDV